MCSCVVVAPIHHGDVMCFLEHTHAMGFYGFYEIFVYQAFHNQRGPYDKAMLPLLRRDGRSKVIRLYKQKKLFFLFYPYSTGSQKATMNYYIYTEE